MDHVEERIDWNGETVGAERRSAATRVRVGAVARCSRVPATSRSLRVRAVGRGRAFDD